LKEEHTDIRSLSKEQLVDFFVANNDKPFRAKQVLEWLWKKDAHHFDEMTNLSKSTRDLLKANFILPKITIDDQQISSDKTIKCAFKIEEGKVVEGVLIPTSSRMTACISSQVGCSLTCKFCATGQLKLMKNLTPGEIVDQVVLLRDLAEDKYDTRLSNIVMMGMGEPLLNYKNVLEAINKITSPEGLGISPSRITLSTAGIAKMIKKMGDDEVKFNLALSLHAADDEKRNEIMPINEHNTLAALAESLKYFYKITNTRVTYEYIIFKNFNDTLHDAQQLVDFCKHIPCKVNIIEYNPIDGGEFEQATVERVDAFANHLEKNNVIVNIRRSRGKDIDAACGQLANKNKAAN